MIEKIVTARGPEYFVGGLVSIRTGEEYSKVTSIVGACGDYEVGSVYQYSVNLKDGRTINVKDAVEIWYSPEEKPEPGYDPRDPA